MRVALIALAAALVAGCSGEPGIDGMPVFNGPPVAQLGSVESGELVPWQDGHQEPIILGVQGTHVWVAVRFQNIYINTVEVIFEGDYVGGGDFCGYRFHPPDIIADGEWQRFEYEVPCFIVDPDAEAGERVRISVTATDATSRSATDANEIVLLPPEPIGP